MSKVIGHYWIKDLEKYRWYWMGKAPRVRKAVELYMARHKPKQWDTSPTETADAISKETGCTKNAIYKNLRALDNLGIIEAVL